MRLPGLLMIGGCIVMATSAGAQAQWRYCLAPSNEAHKVYLSDPFLATAPLESVEAVFKRMLQQSGVAFDDVQCPLGGSEGQIISARKHAIEFNQEFFKRAAVELHVTPVPSLASPLRSPAQ